MKAIAELAKFVWRNVQRTLQTENFGMFQSTETIFMMHLNAGVCAGNYQ